MQGLNLPQMNAEALKNALSERLRLTQSAAADDVTFVNLHLPSH